MKKCAVVGGGLVGPLWAITMRKLGYSVDLYEKRPEPQLNVTEGRSINLVITAKGVQALKQVDLWEKVKGLTCPVRGRAIHPISGALDFRRYGLNSKEYNFSVSRHQLNCFLLDRARDHGVNCHFNHRLLRYTPGSLHFDASGVEIKCKAPLVFGADGAGSPLRKSLVKLQEHGREKTTPLGHSYKELLMPLSPTGRPAMEKDWLHLWPRGPHMLMGLPNLDGSFTMTLYLPDKGDLSFSCLNSPARLRQYFEKYFPDTLDLLPHLEKDYFSRREGFLGTLDCQNWVYRDKVALLGDAAHAITPFFGQGMNAAFSDCTLLAQLHGDRRFKGDWGAIFEEYQRIQRPNGQAIAEMALENFYEMCDHAGREEFLRKKKIEEKLESHFPSEYRSRYAMVTYGSMGYHLAQQAGVIQKEILNTLSAQCQHPDQVNLVQAQQLIRQKLVPFLQKNKIDLHFDPT